MVLHHGREGDGDGRDEVRPSASTACWAALLRVRSAHFRGMIRLRRLGSSCVDLPISGLGGMPTRVVKERMAFNRRTRLNLVECPEMSGVVVLREPAEAR